MASPSFETAKSTFPSRPQVKSLIPSLNAFLIMKKGCFSPDFQIQILESPPEVARYVEQEKLFLPPVLEISFFNEGLNLQAFTFFLCPFK